MWSEFQDIDQRNISNNLVNSDPKRRQATIYLEMETEKGKEVKTVVWSRESHISKFFSDKVPLIQSVSFELLYCHSVSLSVQLLIHITKTTNNCLKWNMMPLTLH